MDYKTARNFLINHSLPSNQNIDGFLLRLQQGKAPIPGQVTNILLSLKIIFESLHNVETLDRKLVYALYQLSTESRQAFILGIRKGINWPPLLDEDINRINQAVKSIFSGVWQS
jgi:hypothetical protein